ncbi:ATP-binding cassette domain-containing protein [Neptunomonas phycophila]|uniref:ATP-binding cassette domain-containing protein n=1 Tax=Neptunomonas phycophila TaxID=1572645 RepID=UPI00094895B0|nr:ATP-binding cassette domain-containing protein [Neptunomonas phycophila]
MLNLNHVYVTLDGYPLHYHFSVKAKEIVAIQGASGVGKTTLLNVIAGFIAPDEGQIVWDNTELRALPVDRRPVAMLFQDHNLFEHLTVMDNLRLGFDQEAPEHLIKQSALTLGVSEHLTKKPHQLSGGQRQRIGLLRTLLRPEPIILLDEPFAELDPATRELAGNWVREISKSAKKTVLLVTHQHEDVERVADRRIELRYPEAPLDTAKA